MPSPRADRKRVLIFEPDAEGHALEWLEHLIRFADDDTEISIVAPDGLCSALTGIVPVADSDRIHLIPLTPLEQRLCLQRPLVLAAFARWWIMRRHVRRSGAEEGFFLMIDLQALPLALGLRMGGARVSGILFRPSVHYGSLGAYTPSRRERVRDWRKGLLYRRMLGNPALARVLSLDPFFATYAQRHYAHGAKVQALPDPAHPPVEQIEVAGNPRDFVPPGRIGFLLFGYLAERKGPLAVLDALALLTPSVAARVAVLFAGRVSPDLADQLDKRRRALATEQPRLWLHVDDRRFGQIELAELIRRSDVVLAPYQRFVGSSGVLLWAARAGRPVLAQEFGLVGKLTREHRLGATVNSSDAAEIARMMTRMIECSPTAFFDRDTANRFAAAQTPQRFASLVLSV